MKKFLRAFGIITLNVATLPLQVILVAISFALAVYCKIVAGVSIVEYFKACIAEVIGKTKDLVHWVKTGRLI